MLTLHFIELFLATRQRAPTRAAPHSQSAAGECQPCFRSLMKRKIAATTKALEEVGSFKHRLPQGLSA